MNTPTLLLPALITLSAISVSAAVGSWQEPGCRQRIPITLPACEAAALPVGMAIRGADFYRWTGYACPAVDSIRLFTDAGPLLFQMEERDSSGQLTSQGNGRLDCDDCLVFTMELSRTPQDLYLYYDGTPASARPTASTTVRVIQQTNQFYTLLVTNGDLVVGLHGGGKEPATNNCMENHGRGALALVTWQGASLANQGPSWANYFPRSIGSSLGAPPWSQPAVIIQGPVRTIIEMHCSGYRQFAGEQETMRADIVHYIAFWSGRSAVVDLEETVFYQSTEFEGRWPYACALPVGKELNENDRLSMTLADKVYTLAAPNAEALKQNPWHHLYATDNPEEGWFAWQDTKASTGFAFFYEKMDTIRERAAWVTYRPALHPDISMRTSPYNAVEISLAFKDRARNCRNRYRRDLRYIFLRSETPEDIRLLYKFWGQPLEQVAVVGWPEVKQRWTARPK